MDSINELMNSDHYEKKLELANLKLKEKIKQLKECVSRAGGDTRKTEQEKIEKKFQKDKDLIRVSGLILLRFVVLKIYL